MMGELTLFENGDVEKIGCAARTHLCAHRDGDEMKEEATAAARHIVVVLSSVLWVERREWCCAGVVCSCV
jgi:hypothetical protein